MSERAPFADGDPAAPPRANGELVFAAPWEGRVFGLAAALEQQGVFAWDDFRVQLIAEIAAAERRLPAEPWSYYACWERALERVLAQRGLCSEAELEQRLAEFAARPHGHDHEPH